MGVPCNWAVGPHQAMPQVCLEGSLSSVWHGHKARTLVYGALLKVRQSVLNEPCWVLPTCLCLCVGFAVPFVLPRACQHIEGGDVQGFRLTWLQARLQLFVAMR